MAPSASTPYSSATVAPMMITSSDAVVGVSFDPSVMALLPVPPPRRSHPSLTAAPRRSGARPLLARHRSVGRWGHEAAIERKRSRHRTQPPRPTSLFHAFRRKPRPYPVTTLGRGIGLQVPNGWRSNAMSRLLGFYETQLRVLGEWRGGPVALLKRLLITLI